MPTYYNIYLPSSLDNNNYIYRLTDDSTVQIITNNNCVTNYNTTNCDCFDFYLNRGVKSSAYSCNRNQTTRILSRTDFGFNDTLANYQATLFSWSQLIVVIGIILTLPSWLIAFATLTISVCILFLVLGRNHG